MLYLIENMQHIQEVNMVIGTLLETEILQEMSAIGNIKIFVA